MQHFHIMTRRSFLDRSVKLGLGVALSTLVDIPLVMKRALAEGSIGLNGKKLLFIFLRGANDGLNSVIPLKDSAYVDSTNGSGTFGTSTTRPNIVIPPDSITDYTAAGQCYFPQSATANDPVFSYNNAITLGNGFAALHPAMKFLAPVYNAGDLALIHRVGYPKQSRSHFDSQNYWENGNPNNNLVKDGIFYRTMIQSGLANTNPLTGVSIQSTLPLILRGSAAAMTNLTDPNRYNLMGIPNNAAGGAKADAALLNANFYPFADKQNRQLLSLQYKTMTDTLAIFSGIDFTENANTFIDDGPTDNDPINTTTGGYYLFPTVSNKNGGYTFHGGNLAAQHKYVVDPGAYSFFTNLKAAALILNNTDAIIAGTEMTGFDTHGSQGGVISLNTNITPKLDISVSGTQPKLLSRIGWAMYALRKYFMIYHNKCTWDKLVVVTLSEFGRTSKQNTSVGTDHAEAGVMFLAGGAVKGYSNPNKNTGNASGVYGCNPNEYSGGSTNPLNWSTGLTGSMFAINSNYLKRTTDYRSMLGKLIRDHLGATQNQLNSIIPGYTDSNEKLQSGGTTGVSSKTDGTTITGELPVV